MIRVEVQSSVVETKAGVSAKTGKSYSIREQEVYIYTQGRDGRPRPHPERAVVSLDDQQAPYPPGNYIIDDSSVYVGRFGMVGMRLRLRPLQPGGVSTGSPSSSARAA